MAKYYEESTIIEFLNGLLNSPFAQGFGDEDNGVLSTYYHNGVKDALKMVASLLEDGKVDAAKIKPATPAEWIKRNDYYYYCSECGSRHTRTDVLHCKYCPDCGAGFNARGNA